ncbi:MAG: hypothetical protein MUQ25_04050 [Candidatus Aminicenantes bacterium]|nr:hypothetical protein [Candidatus Aminicenantes bacterium]
MPARSERITVVPEKSGQPIRIVKFPYWWERGAFFEKYRHREVDLGNPIDANYAWLLSAAEAVAWDERWKREFSTNPLSADPNVLEEMSRLTSALVQAGWVIVESYEWESGLD